MKIAITGHRPNKLGNDYDFTSNLIRNIRLEIMRHLVIIQSKNIMDNIILITGMALGIDTLFAQIAISMKFPFIASIPCFNQDKVWSQKSKEIYNQILSSKLCTLKVISECEYNSSVMQKRNEWMVDNCDLLIAVWDNSAGGTANCVKYAKSKNKEIIYINPQTLV